MNHIETAILNCYGIQEAEQNMVFAARLTQRGHTIRNMEDLMDLYHQTYSKETVEHIAGLPHPTVQKFMVITVAVVGASRRFLTQITRHQNEVKYMSASLQYSNYSGHAAFAIPYEILKAAFRNFTQKAASLISIIMKNSALLESVMMLLDMRHHRDCEMS